MVQLCCQEKVTFLCSPSREFASSIQERLIRGPGDLSDLVAIKNNRGYERGMPGYTAYRRLCGLSVPRRFGALRRLAGFSGRAIRALRRVFNDVDDIPLFSGGKLTLQVSAQLLHFKTISQLSFIVRLNSNSFQDKTSFGILAFSGSFNAIGKTILLTAKHPLSSESYPLVLERKQGRKES